MLCCSFYQLLLFSWSALKRILKLVISVAEKRYRSSGHMRVQEKTQWITYHISKPHSRLILQGTISPKIFYWLFPLIMLFKLFKDFNLSKNNMQIIQQAPIYWPPQIYSDQISRSVMSYSLRPHESQHARPPCPSPTPGVHWDSTSIESVMPSSHLILCRPLLLLPPIPPSIRVFSSELTLHIRWPKYWRFRFSIIPSKEIPGLISFRMDRLDLLAVQGTLKSLLQHHSSKASILQRSAFFTVQLSHPYMTTGKTLALTWRD